MPRILVTNDDGVYAEGIRILARALEGVGEVVIVAPLGESSAIGHALTLARPLRLEQLQPNIWCVDGTPTDCINLAVTRVLDQKPDLVVSGINKGYNLGDDVTYSGTVAGAIEGTLIGVPSIAVSVSRAEDVIDYSQAAVAAAELAATVLEHGLPRRVGPSPVRLAPIASIRPSPAKMRRPSPRQCGWRRSVWRLKKTPGETIGVKAGESS
jgi:5'-nucleotidase